MHTELVWLLAVAGLKPASVGLQAPRLAPRSWKLPSLTSSRLWRSLIRQACLSLALLYTQDLLMHQIKDTRFTFMQQTDNY